MNNKKTTNRQPKVSIIIQNWNGENHIKDCLDSVFKQDYKDIEVVVVDSASKDRSLEIIKMYKKVKLIALPQDKGAPYANNLGVKSSTGKYIMLLNNDTILLKNTIQTLVDAVGELGKDANGVERPCVVSPIQTDWHGKPNGFGCPHYWAGTSLNKLFRKVGDGPFYLSIACCLLPKKLYEEYQLNDHFWFYEETEWAWRLHLKDIPQFLVENAFFKHKLGGSMNPGKAAFFVAKGSMATHLICLKSHTFTLLMPLIFYHHMRLIVAETLKNKNSIVIKKFLAGLKSFLFDIDLFFKDRYYVQKTRLHGDWFIIKKMENSAGYVEHMEKIYSNTRIN